MKTDDGVVDLGIGDQFPKGLYITIWEHFGRKHEAGSEPGPVLVELGDFISMLEAVGGFELSRRALLSYSSPRINLIEPPLKKDGNACYVFPDHFDRMAMILTLRR